MIGRSPWNERVGDEEKRRQGEKQKGDKKITRHTELMVYQRAFEAAMAVSAVTKTLAKEETTIQ
jgi:hypothetical protein